MDKLTEMAANLALADYYGVPISQVEGLRRAIEETRRLTLDEAAEVAELHGGKKIARQIRTLASQKKGDGRG